MDKTLCVGTSGLAVWFSDDDGETWERPLSECGLYLECRVWAIASHPARPGQIIAGTDVGFYVGDLKTRTWIHKPSPMDYVQIWALAIHPDNPEIILAGTRPAGIFRSTDGGKSWVAASADFPDRCIFVDVPRITQILFDPGVRDRVWCSLEIGGIYRSDDAGASWTKVPGEGLISEDIHGIAVTITGQRRLWAAANKGFHVSEDDGETFAVKLLDTPAQYTRTVVTRADGDAVMFLSNGNGPPGDSGRLLRSRDLGESWQIVDLPGTLNSTVWCMATHAQDRDLIYCASNLGQLFRSTDGGETWVRLGRELGEVRCIHWAPR